ncbi:MAG: helix-hairpin-helix domain-containing protein [Methanobacterium paludis]|nr:helix-hairpin-helix domain-containing protein [Methanobacterium paludis]
MVTLPVGDVIAGNILVERKEIADFASSITDGRYKNQSVNMVEASNNGAHCYEIIQGSFKEYESSGYCSISRKAFRGAIASLNERHGIRTLQVDDEVDFWLQIDRLIEKYNDKRPVKRVYVTPTAPRTDERMLLGLPGLGEVRAEKILEKFSLHQLFHCTVEDLMTVEGIGAKYATRIVNELQGGAVE